MSDLAPVTMTPDLPLPLEWLKEEDRSMFAESMKYFSDTDGGMSAFQIINFVLNDAEYPTPASKYFHCRTELFGRYTNIVNAYHDCLILEAEVELLDAQRGQLHGTTAVRHAMDKLLSAKREQKLMRIAFVKKEASRQLREMKVFWDTHQYYGKFLNPGVTKEMAEPETWVLRAAQKVLPTQWIAKWFKGKEPDQEYLRRMLAGPLAGHRQILTQRHVADQIAMATRAVAQLQTQKLQTQKLQTQKEGR